MQSSNRVRHSFDPRLLSSLPQKSLCRPHWEWQKLIRKHHGTHEIKYLLRLTGVYAHKEQA